MRLIGMVAVTAALAGCASLPKISGQPLDVAIKAYGPPHEERTIAGHHYIVWTRSLVFQGDRLNCELVAEVDALNVIGAVQMNGETSACAAF